MGSGLGISSRQGLYLWAALLACLAANAPARDWPQWCGTDGKNMVSEEKGIPASFVPGEKDMQGVKLATTQNVKWGVRLGATTYSSPAVAEGKVFIGTAINNKGALKCLDAQTGKLLWQWVAPERRFPDQINGRRYMMNYWQPKMGMLSSASVEKGRVYFVSQRCEVVCLDTAGAPDRQARLAAADNPTSTTEMDTSETIWKYDFYNELGVRPADVCNGSILIDGDFLYVATSNGVDRIVPDSIPEERRPPPAPDAPNLIVLDKKTGRLLATDDVKIGMNMLHGQWSSPSLGIVGRKKLVFFGGGDGKCYAFEALTKTPKLPVKLKTAWVFDCNPPEYKCYDAIKMDPVEHYVRGDKRRANSLNKKSDGTFAGMSEIIATPVFYKNRVYVAIGRDPAHGRGRGALWCIDATRRGEITKSGKIWCYQGLDRSLCNVSIADGLLYIGDVAGRLHCLDAATGNPYWVHETKSEEWGPQLVADGKIWMPTHKMLWVLAAGKEKKVLSQINLGAPMYVSPVAANGTLYIASKNYLWAVAN